MSPQDWAEEQASRIAGEVRRLRKEQGLSAQSLADLTAERGYTVTRAVIADLENGRRKYVTTAELVVLAQALNTAPIALMYPGPYEESVEYRPGVRRAAIFAVQWFSGLRSRAYDDAAFEPERVAQYDRNLSALQAAREWWDLNERRGAILKRLWAAKDNMSAEEESALVDAIADLQRRADALGFGDVFPRQADEQGTGDGR